MPSTSSWLSALAGVEAPLGPLSAFAPGGKALLLARVVLLAAAFAGAASPPPHPESARGGDGARAGALRGLALVGAAFVASLAVQGAFLPFAGLAAIVVFRSRSRAILGAGLGGLLGCLGLLAFQLRPMPPEVERGPAADTVFLAAHDNAFRAQAAARRWSALEGPSPSVGAMTAGLALARIARSLGHDQEARRLAERVALESPDAELRGQARALLEAWGPAP